MTEITTVCFDWGGVLLRICRTWEEGCAAAGIEIRPRGDEPAATDARRALVHDFQIGKIDEHAFFQGVSETTDGTYAAGEIEKIHHAWLLGEYEGVPQLIDDLNQHTNIRTALLSNTNAAHWRRQRSHEDGLPHFPSAGRVDLPHASHLLGHAKPDESIYRAFERAVGVEPGGIIFFDDLAENIASARAAGWRAVQVDHTGDTVAQIRSELHQVGLVL